MEGNTGHKVFQTQFGEYWDLRKFHDVQVHVLQEWNNIGTYVFSLYNSIGIVLGKKPPSNIVTSWMVILKVNGYCLKLFLHQAKLDWLHVLIVAMFIGMVTSKYIWNLIFY